MSRYFALVPAAGYGSRMADSTPKQYLPIGGQPLLAHTVRRLAAEPLIEQIFVVLAPVDRRFCTLDWSDCGDKVEPLYCGGATRSASVFNGLLAARDAVESDDWMLVHDAARPCVSRAAISRLIREVGADEAGGLLALPVADTLKRGDDASRVTSTEPRASLWRAQTPQMFRYDLLVDALHRCGPDAVTDEAGAIEKLGLKPRLVMGEACNVKVTFPEDLELAALVLAAAAR